MTPDTLHQLKLALEQLVNLPPPERAAFIARVATRDTALAAELHSLTSTFELPVMSAASSAAD